MTSYSRIASSGSDYSLVFDCGALPVDETAVAAGRNPNGYFWEGVVTFGFPQWVESLELDSEAGMFAAYGSRDHIQQLQRAVDPLLSDPQKLKVLLNRADEAGFEFED